MIGIGDVLCIRTGGIGGLAIRLGAAFLDRPNLINHIAIVHHIDRQGRTWVIEGKPGGVGQRDARDYLSSPWTISNEHQPKTWMQRQTIANNATKMLSTPYDWLAIAGDVADAFHLPHIWDEDWHGRAPGHVVCSSLAAYLYVIAGLASPKPKDAGRTTPADWEQFIIVNRYG